MPDEQHPAGLRLQPRYFVVSKAEGEASLAFLDIAEKHGLTFWEAMYVLNRVQADVLRWALRKDRHPRSPGKKADEE